MKFLWCILILAVVRAEDPCPVYKHDDSQFKGKDCYTISEKEPHVIYIRDCSDGQICDLNKEGTLGTCRDYPLYKKYPGEYCEHMDECITRVCTKEHRCYGHPEGTSCNSDSDCDWNLYCKDTAVGIEGAEIKKCAPAAKSSETCREGSCDPPFVCNKGICERFGSLQDNSPADNWEACKGFHLLNNTCITLYEVNNENITEPKEFPKCDHTYHWNNTKGITPISTECGLDSKKYCNPSRPAIKISYV